MKPLLLFFFFITGTYMVQAQVDEEETEEEIILEDIDFDEKVDTIDIDDIDIDDIDEDELSRQSTFPWNKFAVGGQLGNLQFGDQTAIAFSPEIVYKATDKVHFGVDGVFEHYKVKRVYDYYGVYDADYTENSIGGRLFSRFTPVVSFPIFLQVEYERLDQKKPYARDPNSPNTFRYLDVEQKLNNANAGLGFYNGPYYLGLFYNFMNKQNKEDFQEAAAEDYFNETGNAVNPNQIDSRNYGNAISFRGGLNIPLGQGDRNKKRDKNKKRKERQEELVSYR